METVVKRNADSIGDRLLKAVIESRWSTRLLIIGIAIVCFMLMSTPANATVQTVDNTDDPSAIADQILSGKFWDTLNYVPFVRWFDAFVVPSPTASAGVLAAMPLSLGTSLATFFLSISGFITYILGISIVIATSTTILNDFIYVMDGLVYKILFSFFGATPGGSVITIVLWIIVVLVVVAVLFLLRVPFMRAISPRSLIFSSVIMILLVGMSVQTAKNHSAESGIGDRNVTSETPLDMSQWTFGSLGWLVSAVNYFSTTATTMIGNAFIEMNNAVDAAKTDGTTNPIAMEADSGACGAYINGMTAAFENTSNGVPDSVKKLFIGYSEMTMSTYFNQVASIATGYGQEMPNSWCRQLELVAGSPTNEQVFFTAVGSEDPSKSIQAIHGGYSTGELYQTQMNVYIDNNLNWKEGGQELASSFFGPNIQAGIDAGALRYYFAACGPDGKLLPGWDHVVAADSNSNEKLSNDDCTSVFGFGISGWESGGIADFMSEFVQGGLGKAISESTSSPSDAFAFASWNEGENAGINAGLDIVGSLIGLAPNGKSLNFIDPQAFVPAIFHSHQSGGSVPINTIVSIISLAFSVMLLRYFAPMALGAVIIQVIGVLILAFLPIILIAMIIPSNKTRSLGVGMLKTYISSTMVQALVITAFSLAFLVQGVLTFAFGSVGLSGIPIIKFLLACLATVLGFHVMKMIIKVLTGLVVTNFKDGVKIGMVAGAPAMASLGLDAPNGPLDREFWTRKKPEGLDDGERVATDENSPVEQTRDDSNLVSSDNVDGDETNNEDVASESPESNRIDGMDKAADGINKIGGMASLVPHPAGAAVGLGATALANGLTKANDIQEKVRNGIDTTFAAAGLGAVANGTTPKGREVAESISPTQPTVAQVSEKVPNPDNTTIVPQSVPGMTPAASSATTRLQISPETVMSRLGVINSTPASVSAAGRTEIDRASMIIGSGSSFAPMFSQYAQSGLIGGGNLGVSPMEMISPSIDAANNNLLSQMGAARQQQEEVSRKVSEFRRNAELVVAERINSQHAAAQQAELARRVANQLRFSE